MNLTKSIIFILAVVLASVIVHAFYLHQVSFRSIVNENQEFKNEIGRLKVISEEIMAAYDSDLTAKIRLVEELQKKT